MTNNLPSGWKRYADHRSNKTFHHEATGMMILSSNEKSTLVRENEVFLEFEGEDHFNEAVNRSKEICGFKGWFKEECHDLYNFPEEAMQESWNAAIDAAINKINGCELVEPDVLRIRLHEAIGSLIKLKEI